MALALDITRKAVVAFYDVNDQFAGHFESLLSGFNELEGCQRAWWIVSEAHVTNTYQHKVRAGATSIDKRSSLRLDRHGPKPLKTNITVPSIHSSARSVYFLPDRVLVREGRAYADVAYQAITAEVAQVRFIEDGGAPSDGTIVGRTWRFVNVRGGPDRRFKNNRELPIMEYAAISLAAENGFRAVWHFSKANVGSDFVRAITTEPEVARGGSAQ